MNETEDDNENVNHLKETQQLNFKYFLFLIHCAPEMDDFQCFTTMLKHFMINEEGDP